MGSRQSMRAHTLVLCFFAVVANVACVWGDDPESVQAKAAFMHGYAMGKAEGMKKELNTKAKPKMAETHRRLADVSTKGQGEGHAIDGTTQLKESSQIWSKQKMTPKLQATIAQLVQEEVASKCGAKGGVKARSIRNVAKKAGKPGNKKKGGVSNKKPGKKGAAARSLIRRAE